MSNVADTTHSEEISTSAAIEASVTTGVSPVASVKSSAVSPDPQPTEGHEEKVVTVTRTSTVTDNATGDIVAQYVCPPNDMDLTLIAGCYLQEFCIARVRCNRRGHRG